METTETTSSTNSTLVSMETTPTETSLKKDIERFVKFFLIKSTQVIVTSRINGGKKVKTECRLPNSLQLADWFNLNIPDEEPPPPLPPSTPPGTTPPPLPHRTILQNLHPHLGKTLPTYSVTIETYLTTEDLTIPLEIWRFLVDAGNLQSPRDVYNIYSRLGLTIRSVLCLTRTMPGYKIARKSGPDVAIGYEIKSDLTDEDFTDEKIASLLGEGFKKAFLGQQDPGTTPTDDSSSPSGSNTTSVVTYIFHRTKMELFTSQKESLLIKSDHYGDGMVAMETKANQVRPAFGSMDQIIRVDCDEGEEEEDDFFKMLRPPPSTPPQSEETIIVPTTTPTPKLPPPPPPPPTVTMATNNPTHIITLPFATHFPSPNPLDTRHSHSTPTTTTNPTHSTNSSNTSESELLNLFEEFRIAPVTLQAFDENCNHDNQAGVLLEQFEGEIGFYEDFFGKTLLCGEE